MRFKKNILPNEIKNEYTPNTIFTINLPQGILDLHSFSLYYRANASVYRHTEFVDKTQKQTFLGNSVNATARTIVMNNHGYANGQEIIYTNAGTGTSLGALVTIGTYYVIRVNDNEFALAGVKANVATDTRVNITTGNAAHTHTITKVLRTYRSTRRFLPRLSSCVISELIVKIENQIVQNTQEYHMLAAILNDIYKEYDDIDSTASDTVQEHNFNNVGNIGNISKLQASVRPPSFVDKYISGSKRSYFIDKWLGFLNEGNRYFDSRNKNIQIQIKLAPANILYRGVNTADVVITGSPDTVLNTIAEYPPDYVVSDLKGTIDVMDEADIPYLGLSKDFEYNDYIYTMGSMVSGSKKTMTAVETDMPVQYVLGTFSHPGRMIDQELQLQHCHMNTAKFGALLKDTLTLADINAKVPNSLSYSYEISKFQKDSYLLNSSAYFIRSGDGIAYTTFKLNNYDIASHMDVISCYNETKKAFGADYKKAQHIYSFESEFFVNAIRVDDYSEGFKRLEWHVEIDPTKTNGNSGVPMLFLCIKNKL